MGKADIAGAVRARGKADESEAGTPMNARIRLVTSGCASGAWRREGQALVVSQSARTTGELDSHGNVKSVSLMIHAMISSIETKTARKISSRVDISNELRESSEW